MKYRPFASLITLSVALRESFSLIPQRSSQRTPTHETPFDRRSFLGRIAVISSFSLVSNSILAIEDAFAIGEGEQRMILSNKPKAPLGALVPAAQQRLLLERCLIALSSNNKTLETDTITQLKSILLQLPSENDSRIALPRGNKDLSVMRQYNPNQILSGDVVRASMNIYTANLRYGEQPQYTVTDPNWKKSFIRANDGLPDVQQVIIADLDLRDLYRNQVQVKLDDASAELYSDNRDLDELRTSLQEAATAFDQWLGRIDDADVAAALDAALQGKSLQVYDSYYAGFIPPK